MLRGGSEPTGQGLPDAAQLPRDQAASGGSKPSSHSWAAANPCFFSISQFPPGCPISYARKGALGSSEPCGCWVCSPILGGCFSLAKGEAHRIHSWAPRSPPPQHGALPLRKEAFHREGHMVGGAGAVCTPGAWGPAPPAGTPGPCGSHQCREEFQRLPLRWGAPSGQGGMNANHRYVSHSPSPSPSPPENSPLDRSDPRREQ